MALAFFEKKYGKFIWVIRMRKGENKKRKANAPAFVHQENNTEQRLLNYSEKCHWGHSALFCLSFCLHASLSSCCSTHCLSISRKLTLHDNSILVSCFLLFIVRFFTFILACRTYQCAFKNICWENRPVSKGFTSQKISAFQEKQRIVRFSLGPVHNNPFSNENAEVTVFTRSIRMVAQQMTRFKLIATWRLNVEVGH